MAYGWMQWMFFYLLIPGVSTLIMVLQPPVLITALGNNVIMPCHLSSNDMVSPPILYWEYQDGNKLWPPSDKFRERVDCIDKNEWSLNKSIVFRNVQWVDSGNYLCKLSILTAEKNNRYRIRGNETQLLIYDTMFFDLVAPNSSLLSCQVNVSAHPGFVMSILHNGEKIHTVKSGCNVRECNLAAHRPLTLSVTISLTLGEKYKCQLHLMQYLITEKNILPEQDVARFPEPWLFYGGFLLVHCVTLTVITATLLAFRRQVFKTVG